MLTKRIALFAVNFPLKLVSRAGAKARQFRVNTVKSTKKKRASQIAKIICGYFTVGLFHFSCKIISSVKTWKYCSVFGSDNSERKNRVRARLQKVSFKGKVYPREEIPRITKYFVLPLPKRCRITEEVV